MAATNYTPISLYYSATSTNTPSAGNLVYGELAINIADGKLYYKNPSNVVTLLAVSGGAITPITNNGVVYINGSGQAVSESALTFDGTNFGTTGNANLGSGSKSTDTQLNFASDLGTQRIYLDRGTRSLVFYDATTAIENYRIAGITGIQSWGVGGSEQMRLTSTGLGIGTSSPAYKLDVTGFARASTVLTNGATSGTNGGSAMLVQNGGTSVIGIGNYSNLLGGAFDNTATIFAAGNLRFTSGSTTTATLDSSGNLGIGTTANASAILDAQSTTKGVRMPNMTTTQKNAIASPVAGLMVFDTTLAKLCVYSGSAWQTITSV